MFSPGLLVGNPPPRWGAPGDDPAAFENECGKRGLFRGHHPTNESLNVRIVFDDCCIECRHLPHHRDCQGFGC